MYKSRLWVVFKAEFDQFLLFDRKNLNLFKPTMTNPLHITLIQPNIVWHDTSANIELVDRLISAITASDLIILPEMWNTGFSMTPAPLATRMDGIAITAMQKWATQKSAIIGGSIIITEDGQYYNRFLLVDSEGPVASYDKKHLFTLAGEHKTYTAGQNVVNYIHNNWKLRLNVCYDLRFPVWSRNTDQYEILIYVANWPSPRHHAWRTLLQARAIENQCYVVGCNRVGTDPNGHSYLGGSTVIDFLGKHIIEMNDQEGVQSAYIDQNALTAFRSKFDFLADRNEFQFFSKIH